MTVETAGLGLPTLNWEDHLVYLCVHALGHMLMSGGISLLWVCDIDRLLRSRQSRPGWDWSRVEASAAEFGLRNVVYLMLTLTGSLLRTGPEIEPYRITRWRQRALARSVADARLGLFGGPGCTMASSSRRLFNLACLVDYWAVIRKLGFRSFYHAW